MVENWKDIEGYKSIYQVSNLGRVKSLDRYVQEKTGKAYFLNGKILSPKGKRYLRVSLSAKSKIEQVEIHRLVAKAFINNIDSKPQVNHKDGNRYNNNVNNLEWCTAKENVRHSNETGLAKYPKGDKRSNVKIPDLDIKLIRFLKGKLSNEDLAYFFNTTKNYINSILGNRRRILAVQSLIGIIITGIISW